MVHPPHRLLTDERLTTLAAEGDERAFATLYRRHEAVLLRYCRSITGDHDDAGDALQNAMVRALGAITQSNAPTGPVRPWLFRIAHNESVNVLRRRRGEVRMADPQPTATAAGADERLAEREALREVVDEIVRLPARQRGALVLRELEGLEYREVASALDVTEVNARQLVFAARSGLAESAAGRRLSCADVRDELATGDQRARRRRRLRAHLHACEACRAYAAAQRGARAQRRVAGLLPQWLIGWTGLQGVFSAGGGAAGSGAGEVAAKGAATLAVVAAAAAAGPAAVQHAHRAKATHAVAQHLTVTHRTARKPAVAATGAPAPASAVASTTSVPRAATTSGPARPRPATLASAAAPARRSATRDAVVRTSRHHADAPRSQTVALDTPAPARHQGGGDGAGRQDWSGDGSHQDAPAGSAPSDSGHGDGGTRVLAASAGPPHQDGARSQAACPPGADTQQPQQQTPQPL